MPDFEEIYVLSQFERKNTANITALPTSFNKANETLPKQVHSTSNMVMGKDAL